MVEKSYEFATEKDLNIMPCMFSCTEGASCIERKHISAGIAKKD